MDKRFFFFHGYPVISHRPVARIQNADNTTVSFTRDALDHILTLTDERGNVTTLVYDANNNYHSTISALEASSLP